MPEPVMLENRHRPTLRAVTDRPIGALVPGKLAEEIISRKHGHRLGRILRWGAGLLILLVLGAAATFEALKPPVVIVVHVKYGPAVKAVYATGTVEPTVMMPIAGRMAGRLVELNVDEGSIVKKDQVLARLEDQDLLSSLDQLRAQEVFARQEFERDEKLLAIGGIARSLYERAKSDWDAAKAAVARANSEANFMKLIAPAEGRILRRDGEIGQLIPANQPVFWLSRRVPLRIAAEVDEEDIAQVKVGQAVLIRADAFPGKIFNGRVQAITPKGDPVARSYRVRIGLTEDTPLLIGMTAETNIIIEKHENALLVPASAVSKGKVWLVEGGKLAERKVEVGAVGPEWTEILGGLAANEDVLLRPQPSLAAGTKVEATSPSPSDSSS